MTGPAKLYRYFDERGRLLYIGMSLRAIARLGEHQKSAEWAKDIQRVEIQNFPCRATALEAEEKAIKTERPVHNKHHNFGTNDAQMGLMMPPTLKDAFFESCAERGLNMSALLRKDIEGHVQRFRQEDERESAA